MHMFEKYLICLSKNKSLHNALLHKSFIVLRIYMYAVFQNVLRLSVYLICFKEKSLKPISKWQIMIWDHLTDYDLMCFKWIIWDQYQIAVKRFENLIRKQYGKFVYGQVEAYWVDLDHARKQHTACVISWAHTLKLWGFLAAPDGR